MNKEIKKDIKMHIEMFEDGEMGVYDLMEYIKEKLEELN